MQGINMNDWECVESGPSFIGADLMFIKETLSIEISGSEYEGSLSKRAGRISKNLKYNIGKGEWQVFLVKGPHARKFVCSRNFFCIFQKKDGLRAYIWVNRFKPEEETELAFNRG
jgi:hypothetical protein